MMYGCKKLTDSEKEILNAKQKYQEKLTEYNTNKKNSETQFDLAKQNLLSAKHQINDAEKKLDLNRNKLQNIDATLKDTRNKLDEK